MIEGYVNEILTGPFQRYRMFGSAAGFVAPRIDVQSSQIRTRSQDALLQTTYEGIVVNHEDPAGRVRIKYNDNPVTLTPRRLRADIGDARRADSQNMVGDIDMDSTEAIAYGLGLDWEIKVRDKAMLAASYTTAGTLLNLGGDGTGTGVTTPQTGNAGWAIPLYNSAADFRTMVEYAINTVASKGGTMIDSMLIPPGVMPYLTNNEIMRTTLRYSALSGFTSAMLAEYLSTQGRQWSPDDIIVPRARHNKGTSENKNFDFVWDSTYRHIILFHRAMPNVAIQDPYFMATYTFEGTPLVATRRASEFIGDIHEGMYFQEEEVEGYERAFMIQNVY